MARGYAGGFSPLGPGAAETAAAPVRDFSKSLPARIVSSIAFDSSRYTLPSSNSIAG